MDALGGIIIAIGEGIVELFAVAWEALHGDTSRVTKGAMLAYGLILGVAIFLVVLILKTGS
jgi:hypothetical protein